jgi:hypothetical protein
VECNPFVPEPTAIEPFPETMARMMMSVATDEIAIQKLIQKRQRRPRRRQVVMPLISAAPEPAAWLLMLSGFGAIGWAMRSRQRRWEK